MWHDWEWFKAVIWMWCLRLLLWGCIVIGVSCTFALVATIVYCIKHWNDPVPNLSDQLFTEMLKDYNDGWRPSTAQFVPGLFGVQVNPWYKKCLSPSKLVKWSEEVPFDEEHKEEYHERANLVLDTILTLAKDAMHP